MLYVMPWWLLKNVLEYTRVHPPQRYHNMRRTGRRPWQPVCKRRLVAWAFAGTGRNNLLRVFGADV